MLVVHKSEKHYCVSNLKLEILLESRLTGHRLSSKNALFSRKIAFSWLANNGVKPPIFKISRLKLQKLLKSCWASDTEC